MKTTTRMLFLFAFVTIMFATVVSAVPGDLKNAGNLGGDGNDRANAVSVYPPGGGFVIAGQADQYSIGNGSFDTLTAKGGIDGIVGIFDYDSDNDNFALGYVYNSGGQDHDIFYAVSYVNNSDIPFGYCAMGEVGPSSFGNGDYVEYYNSVGKGEIDAAIVTSYGGDLSWPPDANIAGTTGIDKIYGSWRWGTRGQDYMIAGTFDSQPMIGYARTHDTPWTKTIASNGTGAFRGAAPAVKNIYDEENAEWLYAAVGHADSTTFNTQDWTGITGKGTVDAIVAIAGWNEIITKINFGGAGDDYFYGVAGDDYLYNSEVERTPVLDGDFIAVGYSASASFDTGDWNGIEGKGEYDATIVRFNADGEVVWQKNFGGAGNDVFTAITPTYDGCFVAVGWSGANTFGDPNGDWATFTGKGDIDAVIVKFDADGNVKWQNNFGGADYDYFNAVAAKENGDIVAVGYSYDGSFETGDFSNVVGKGGTDITYAVFSDIQISTLKYLEYPNNQDIVYFEDHIVSGDTVELPETPSRVGFIFKGWFLNEKCTIPFDTNAPVEAADLTLYPGWKADGNDVTVSYNNGSGSYQNLVKAYGSQVTLTAINTGVPFSHWEDGEGHIRSYNATFTFVATEDIELTSIYDSVVPDPQPTVNIDKTNTIITAPDGDGRVKVSFFGDVVVPNGFTVLSRGMIGSYYVPGDQYYDWTESTFTLDTHTGISRVNIPGVNTKIQAVYNRINPNTSQVFLARVFLVYEDSDGIEHTIYSDIAYGNIP